MLERLIYDRDITKKIYRGVKRVYIPVLLLAIYLGMTSYAVLYPDSIKLSTPLAPGGIVYKYSDVKRVDVGVSKGLKTSYEPYYKLYFKEGRYFNFFGGSLEGGNELGGVEAEHHPMNHFHRDIIHPNLY